MNGFGEDEVQRRIDEALAGPNPAATLLMIAGANYRRGLNDGLREASGVAGGHQTKHRRVAENIARKILARTR